MVLRPLSGNSRICLFSTYMTKVGGFNLQAGACTCHLNGLGERTNFQADVDAYCLVHVQFDLRPRH